MSESVYQLAFAFDDVLHQSYSLMDYRRAIQVIIEGYQTILNTPASYGSLPSFPNIPNNPLPIASLFRNFDQTLRTAYPDLVSYRTALTAVIQKFQLIDGELSRVAEPVG